jgi:hypothetical protein
MLPRAPVPATQPDSGGQDRQFGEFTATPGPLTGTWVASVIRNGELSENAFTFTLEHGTDAGRMRGYMFSRYGEGRMRRVEFNSDTGELTFRFPTEMGGNVNYKATVKGEEMTGTLGSEDAGFTMEFSAKRDSSEIRAPAEGAEASGRENAAPAGRAGQSAPANPRGGQ